MFNPFDPPSSHDANQNRPNGDQPTQQKRKTFVIDPTNPEHFLLSTDVSPATSLDTDNVLMDIFSDLDETAIIIQTPKNVDDTTISSVAKDADSRVTNEIPTIDATTSNTLEVTTTPISLVPIESTSQKERPLERISSEVLITGANSYFKNIIDELKNKINKKKKFVGQENEYSGQVVARQILNYFSGKEARITNAYKIQEKVLEIAAIAKELCYRDMRDKGNDRRREIWDTLVYSGPKKQLEDLTKIPLPK